MKWRIRWAMFVLAWLGVILPFTEPVRAQSPDGELVAVITSPVDEQQLFGMVSINGSAQHPGSFASYTLEYDDLSDPADLWLPVQERVTQQVNNSVLGAWNTNAIPDGIYQLRLRVTLSTGDVGEYVVRGLQVVNSAPTAVPTVAGSGQNNTPLAITPGPSPTSPVQQPPSNNPGESSTGLNPGNSQPAAPSLLTDDEPGAKTTINVGRVQDALCAGAVITGSLFLLTLSYAAIRERFRPKVQDTSWPHRNTPQDPY